MNGLLLSRCLIVAAVIYHQGDAAGQFTAAPPACPGDTFTFSCTVVGNKSGFTIWRVGGSTECPLVHKTPPPYSIICGSHNVYTAMPGTGFATSGPSFTSTLNGTANLTMDSTQVECFGPANNADPGNRVNGSTLKILDRPSVTMLTCVDLSGGVNGDVNITVNWTLSVGDSADFYLIEITTNAPNMPYGGLLNITTASVTQYELTGFIEGYEYNITVRGVNCGGHEGSESEPLTIRPQVPAVPTSCNITLLYDQSSGRLQIINSTWDSMPNPVDQGEVCSTSSGIITQHQMKFQTGTFNITQNLNTTRCTAGRCSHTFQPPSNTPLRYDSVSVAAVNLVGVGTPKLCSTQTINTTNNLLTGGMVDASSPNNATINCTFLSGFTGSARCTVQYGTDPTYMNLPYSAVSTETGTAGDSVSVVLRERLNSSTVYYYTVSTVSGDVTAVVQGTFTTPQYRIRVVQCSSMDLWNLPATGFTFLQAVNLLQNAAQYPSCGNTSSAGSAVLVDKILSTATVTYYTGTTPGSRACFVCDENSIPNTTFIERVCQSDATWSGSPILCVCMQAHLTRWHVGLIVIGAIALVVSIVTTITVTAVSCQRINELKWWHIVVMVVTAVFCLIGVVLWITVGAVVNNPPNDNMCDPGWRRSCDALVILGFVFSILPIILVPTVPFIYTPLKGHICMCCKKWGVKSKPRQCAQPGRSDELQLRENEVAVPGYDIIQHDQARPRAVLNPSESSYSHITEVTTGLRYAELGPHIPPAAVAPPPIDNMVWYTSLLHDQNHSEPNAHIPAGSLPASDGATSNSQSPLGSPPPIPPQQFSNEDILLLPKLSESMELQEDGRDTPPPIPPKINEEDVDLPQLPPKMNEEDKNLPPLPPEIDEEDTSVPPLPPKAKQRDTVLLSCPPKTNQEEGVILPQVPSQVNQEDTTLPPLPPKRERADTALYSCPPKANQEHALLPPLPPKVIQENAVPPPLPPKETKKTLQSNHATPR